MLLGGRSAGFLMISDASAQVNFTEVETLLFALP